ncbi:MAG: transposase, partial [Leptolyngbyaceae cyanobacterium RM2_2_4]|nr:transposase [Leptolyngbyaceae cyanobacterium RM2_2_4]
MTATGTLSEGPVMLEVGGEDLALRRIRLQLNKPTRDNDGYLDILTNLPDEVSAEKVAELYRKRWTLETLFQSLTSMLASELNTLGYPRAAILAFAVALATYNVLSTVQASLRAKFGTEKVQEEVSGYYLANEVRKTHEGM